MRRIAALTLFLTAACSGGGGGGATGPAAVASVSLTAAASSVAVGQTTTVTATPKDASGNALTGRAVTFSSSNNAIATVSSTGTVTGVSIGTVVITATVESKSATTPVTVVLAGPNCAGSAGVSLSVGQVRELSGAERTTLCLPATGSGAEYALIPVNTDPNRQSATVSLLSSNTVAATGLPTVVATASARASARASAMVLAVANNPVVPTPQAIEGVMPRDIAFERQLRLRTRDLMRSVHAAKRALPSAVRSIPGARSNIINFPTNPSLGTLVALNVNSNVPCASPIMRTGRVAAISSTAIVVEDTTAPAGGFSDAEYLSIARTFDTLVFNLDTLNFGAPFDMDGNGKVLMFFTTAVNQLTAANATSVIGGFFFERDLIPRNAPPNGPTGGQSCATSNEGEMFYLPVVDAGSKYNGYFKSKSAMLTSTNSTTVHEFQHLINASRRIYVTPEVVDDEEDWLNEGMSHLAEELLWYEVTGLTPKQNYGFSQTMSPALQGTTISYQIDNLARFNDYLTNTESNSAYALNDDLSTRGAGWAILRYSLDQSPSAARTYLKGLVDAPTQGIPNFDRNFTAVGGLAGAVKAMVVANYADDAGLGVAPAYTFPSWNYRDWLPHFTANGSRYPLNTRPLTVGTTMSVTLAAGGSSVIRFRVNGGSTGGIATTIAGAAPSTSVALLLLRTQ